MFLLKYKRKIISWIVFLALVLYFAPKQHDYYLDDDIKSFKTTYFTPFLIWTGIIASLLIFLITFLKSKSIKQSGVSFLYAGVIFAFLLFIFQNLFLGASLFLNRQFKRETLQKSYSVSYLTGIEHTKDNFFPFDIANKHSSFDRKLRNKLYYPGINQNDTVTLQFDKGLFGIPFQSKPFNDK